MQFNDLVQMRYDVGVLNGRIKKRTHALLAGGERSPFKGRGMDFEESRRYQSGDDVRFMDWRVMARTNEPYLKIFREERERPVFLMVDDRRAMRFGTKVAYKSVIAAKTAALLGWASHARGDRVGAVLFGETYHEERRPKGGRTGVLQLLHLLSHVSSLSFTPSSVSPSQGHEPFTRALHRVLQSARPGSLVFILSDFREWKDPTRTAFLHLSRRHDVVAVFIYDQLEREAPPPGKYPVTDGQHVGLFNTSSLQTVQSYTRRFTERWDSIQSLCRSLGVGFIPIATHENIASRLRWGLQDLGYHRSASQRGMSVESPVPHAI